MVIHFIRGNETIRMSKPRICNVCRKTFSSRQSPWKHKQKCCSSYIDNHYLQRYTQKNSDTECKENFKTEKMTNSEESILNSDDKSKMSTYTWKDNGSINRKHCIWLPRSVRAIIVGKSGFGKTTLLTSLLLDPDVMDYEKLMICGKSLHQPEYRVMELGFGKGLSKNQVRRLFRDQQNVVDVFSRCQFGNCTII